MLFRTVYGPELKAIYQFITTQHAEGKKVQRKEIYAAFIPRRSDNSLPSTQNVDDALAFLKSAKMIDDCDGFYSCNPTEGDAFVVALLRAMRCIEKGKTEAGHKVDPLYTLLVTELFVKHDCLFIKDVHREANQLRQVREAGGLSKEKIQAWKRAMEYLGVGRRAFGGFLCVYMPELILTIIDQWDEKQGTLQSFFTEYLDSVLPYSKADGELARSIAAPLAHLAEQEYIELFPLQDSPTRPYFPSHYKGIARRLSND